MSSEIFQQCMLHLGGRFATDAELAEADRLILIQGMSYRQAALSILRTR